MSGSPRGRPELLRILGFWTAVAVVVGSVIGSGVFKKPQAVAQNVEHFELAITAWVLGGVLALLGALALAELGAMLPRAGGNYVFLKEGYSPLWGFLWGWVEFWILRTGSIAALATIFSESLAEIIKHQHVLTVWEQRAITTGLIAALAIVNALGVRWGGLVQDVSTWLKVLSLVTIAVLPFVMREAQVELLSEPGVKPAKGLLVGFGAAVLGVLWAYHGWMNLSPLGEELRDPQRNVPRALFIGVGILIALYVSANIAYAVVLPQSVMADTGQVKVVATSFAEELFRGWGTEAMSLAGKAISAAIMLSVFGALNANILIGPRTYFALGRDGLFPSFFGQVHARFRTPVASILLQALWAIGLVLGSDFIRENPLPKGPEPLRKEPAHLAAEKLALIGGWTCLPLPSTAMDVGVSAAMSRPPAVESPFDTLTNYVMFGAIIFETMVIASIFRFRRLHPDWPRPYRCWGYPVVPIVYVVVLTGVLANTIYDQPNKSAWGLGFIVAGALVYLLFARGRQRG